MVEQSTKSLRLGYTSHKVDLDDSDCARVFGELLRLAEGNVKAYTSDLYHDAMWLRENVAGKPGTSFYYGVRESGTSLAWSVFTVRASCPAVWRVTVRVIDGSTILDIDAL